MREVEIRWANQYDGHDVAVVHVQAYRSAYKNIMPDHFIDSFTVEKREEYYQKMLRESSGEIALLFTDHKASGFMIIGKSKDHERCGEIVAIYLLQECWGKGLGKRLINWAMDKFNETGYKNIVLWVLRENVNARKFYEHLGFIFDGTEREINRGEELMQMRYKKRLAR